MRTSFSKSVTVRPALEQLESRDMPSTLGSVLPFVTDQLIVQKGLKNSDAWSSTFQNDFNNLQLDIVQLGPANAYTIAALSKTTADYGFFQQTANLTANTVELFRGAIAFGISNGFFDESDAVPILFSLRDIQHLMNITDSQANTVNAIAHIPFANGVTLGGVRTIAELTPPPNLP